MQLEYKYVLGEEYYVVDGWTISRKVTLTGVVFNKENVLYNYNDSHRWCQIKESNLASTLEEAKEKCLKRMDKDFLEIKEEVIKLTESDFNKKGE